MNRLQPLRGYGRPPEVLQCDADPVVARFARSLHSVDAAFPSDTEYAAPLERPATWRWSASDAVVLIGCAAAALCFAVLAVAGSLPGA